jgi:hypothetical protein
MIQTLRPRWLFTLPTMLSIPMVMGRFRTLLALGSSMLALALLGGFAD